MKLEWPLEKTKALADNWMVLRKELKQSKHWTVNNVEDDALSIFSYFFPIIPFRLSRLSAIICDFESETEQNSVLRNF